MTRELNTLQINRENQRLQVIKTILTKQYRAQWRRINEGKGGAERLQPLRKEIKSVSDRIQSNWQLHKQ